jgi:hypothetical protein
MRWASSAFGNGLSDHKPPLNLVPHHTERVTQNALLWYLCSNGCLPGTRKRSRLKKSRVDYQIWSRLNLKQIQEFRNLGIEEFNQQIPFAEATPV